MNVSAIVLAGGRSSRFGRDKLAEPFKGQPLLAHAVTAARSLADDVVVVLSPDAAKPTLPMDVRFARDPEPFGGPLVGLVAGLGIVVNDRVLVVAGDMPSLHPEVMTLLLTGLETAPIVALEDDGLVRPLPMAVERRMALDHGRRLRAAGERSLRALMRALPGASIPEADWRRLDPTGATIRDVDLPGDVPIR